MGSKKISAEDKAKRSLTEFLETASKIEACIDRYKSYTNDDLIYQLRDDIEHLKAQCGKNDDESDILRIGIIGGMKAGKSSFLNMLLFGGKDVLPKAPTPMTAALTRLVYGERNTVTIHFFDRNAWDQIRDLDKKCREKLDQAYKRYCEFCHQKQNESGALHEKNNSKALAHPENADSDGLGRSTAAADKPLSKQGFERKFRSNGKDYGVTEYEISAHELVTDVETRHGVLDKIGQSEVVEIDGDLKAALEEYVGANGRYTSIVNYVEMTIHEEALQGIEIIDTPGLGDPVVSRTKRTQEFLKQCSAVLFLSRTNEFFANGDIEMLFNRLPGRGISEIIVLASRFDGAVCGDLGKNINLDDAIRHSYEQMLDRYNDVLSTQGAKAAPLRKHRPIPVSAMAHAIAEKLDSGDRLTEDEEVTWNNLKTLNGGEPVPPERLRQLSGLDDFIGELRKLLENKKEILQRRSIDSIAATKKLILELLTDLIKDVGRGIERLAKEETKEIAEKRMNIENGLDKAADKLSAIFEEYALAAKKKIQKLQTSTIPGQMSLYSKCEEPQIHTERRSETVPEGWFGWKKRHITWDEKIYTLGTDAVKRQLNGYASCCAGIVSDEFDRLVNIDQLRREIIETVIAAIGERMDNEDDVLVPLRRAIAKIKLPKLEISPAKYVDIVNAKFPSGCAEGNDIHQLRSLLSDELFEVQKDIGDLLDASAEEIGRILDGQASTFSTEIRKTIGGELGRLEEEAKDKERHIKLRGQFRDELRRLQEALVQP